MDETSVRSWKLVTFDKMCMFKTAVIQLINIKEKEGFDGFLCECSLDVIGNNLCGWWRQQWLSLLGDETENETVEAEAPSSSPSLGLELGTGTQQESCPGAPRAPQRHPRARHHTHKQPTQGARRDEMILV